MTSRTSKSLYRLAIGLSVSALALGVATLSAIDPAAAQTLRLRAEAVVAADVIRLDHLVEGLETGGDVPLFRAPMPGGRGTIRADRIIQAAREIGVTGIAPGDVVAVAVSRPGRNISRMEMADPIARFVNERQPGTDVAITLDDQIAARIVDAGRSGGVKVVSLSREPRSGRFEARLTLPGPGELGDSWIVTGSIAETQDVAVPVADLDRGDAIEPRHLVIIKRPAGQVGSDVIRPIADLVGLVPRRALRAGEPVRSGDVAKPILVEKGSIVRVSFEAKGMTLSLVARAQTSGAKGDTIKLQNQQSKRVIEGTITGPGQVAVSAAHSPPPATLAAAPAAPRN